MSVCALKSIWKWKKGKDEKTKPCDLGCMFVMIEIQQAQLNGTFITVANS